MHILFCRITYIKDTKRLNIKVSWPNHNWPTTECKGHFLMFDLNVFDLVLFPAMFRLFDKFNSETSLTERYRV